MTAPVDTRPTVFAYLYRGLIYVGSPTLRWLPLMISHHGSPPHLSNVETPGCWPCVRVTIKYADRASTMADLLNFEHDFRWQLANRSKAYERFISGTRCDGLHVAEPEAMIPVANDSVALFPKSWGFDAWKQQSDG